jgi:hypothetical protein
VLALEVCSGCVLGLGTLALFLLHRGVGLKS